MSHTDDVCVTDDINILLDHFARELDYFVFTRDHLEPVMRELLEKAETYFASRDAADFAAAREMRTEYVNRMEGIGPLLTEWVAIRGAGERLWEAEHAMSTEQFERFQSLLDREGQVSAGREQFDLLQERLRQRLLLLEELSG